MRLFPPEDDLFEVLSADGLEGWCIKCGKWTADLVEPDARRYPCPECGDMKVYGSYSLILMMSVRINPKKRIEDNDPDLFS